MKQKKRKEKKTRKKNEIKKKKEKNCLGQICSSENPSSLVKHN